MTALSFFLVFVLADTLLAQTKGDAKRGEDLYIEKCVLCHGSQGQGWDWTKKVASPPVPVPDLAKIAPQRSDQFLFDVVTGGGEAVGKTRFMPPFGFQLSDREVWDLVAYVRSLGSKK
ncbi:MAG: cytochrome c [Deltaproteobacteria bacterium]|nr:cytochrome c [Deltaproteobacteria bacterium]